MDKDEKKGKISPLALNIIKGIFVVLLGVFLILSPNTFFSFFSIPIVYLFGWTGFWTFIPFMMLSGFLSIFKSPTKDNAKINLIVIGFALIVAAFLIVSTNFLINEYLIQIEDPDGYLTANTFLNHFNGVYESLKSEASTTNNMYNLIYAENSQWLGGGLFGYLFAGLLNTLFKGTVGTTITCIVLAVIALMLIFHHEVALLFAFIVNKIKSAKEKKNNPEEVIPEEVILEEEDDVEIIKHLPYEGEDESLLKSEHVEKAIPYTDEDNHVYNRLDLINNSFNNSHSLTKAVFLEDDDGSSFKGEESFLKEKPRIDVKPEPVIERKKEEVVEPKVESIIESDIEEEEEIDYSIADPVLENRYEEKESSNDDYVEPTPAKEEVNPEIKVEPKVEAKPESRYEAKEEPKVEPKVEVKPVKKPYVLPSIDLLTKHESVDDQLANKESCDRRMAQINEVFKDLNIGASVVSYTVGPTVTQYDVLMNSDKSISILDRYINDIQIRLFGIPIRFEKLVAGKRTSGLEMENEKRTVVGLRECIEELNPISESTRYEVPFGRGIDGKVIKASLIKFPHLLVAGTTGSGKSIFLHSLLISLLMRNTPDQLRLLLIDPKVVEMNYYKNIPHLLAPNISEAKQACLALNELCDLMDERYRIFSDVMANDIKTYNAIAKAKGLETMPRIVVLIDEYADLNDECKDIRIPVSRLAQKARTAGIHLIVATQRPSVGVIDGVIKSNIVCRVALKVSVYHDSEVILGEAGAEKLCGNGDMIISIPEISNTIKPRVQGAFVDITEIIAVTDRIRANGEPNFDTRFLDLDKKAQESAASAYQNGEVTPVDKDAQEDELLEIIKNDLMSREYCSISYIQRSYGVGFPKAGRLFIKLQDMGIVSRDSDSSHGCRVLIKKESEQNLGSIEVTDVKLKD